MKKSFPAGIVLLTAAAWIFVAVMISQRPGRMLLGDALYGYWPVQPAECLMAGLVLLTAGVALIAVSPNGRTLLAQFRSENTPPSSPHSPSHPRNTVSAGQPTDSQQSPRDATTSGTTAAPPANAPTASTTPLATAALPPSVIPTPVLKDHHGI